MFRFVSGFCGLRIYGFALYAFAAFWFYKLVEILFAVIVGYLFAGFDFSFSDNPYLFCGRD
jgi:hypothetical protein